MQRFSGLPCLALKLSFHSRLIVTFIGSFALHLRATFARAIRSAAHFRYLRASWDSLSPKRSKKHFLCDGFRPLACLARKLTFSSRLIVAFISSFAMPLLSVVRKCYSLRSPFPLPARVLGLIVAETLEKAFLMRRFSSPRLPRSETIVSFAFDRSVHRLVRVSLARYVCKCFSLRSPFPLR